MKEGTKEYLLAEIKALREIADWRLARIEELRAARSV